MMRRREFEPATAVFLLISFEGPDRYSRVGGAADRVCTLAGDLADLGFETHHFFLGDPGLPARQRGPRGRLTLHRWGQWLSALHPAGVYQEEDARARDLAGSLPPHLVPGLIVPALRAGFTPALIAFDWQLLPFVRTLDEALIRAERRDQVALWWELDSPEAVGRVDWSAVPVGLDILSIDPAVETLLQTRGQAARLLGPGGAGVLEALGGSPAQSFADLNPFDRGPATWIPRRTHTDRRVRVPKGGSNVGT